MADPLPKRSRQIAPILFVAVLGAVETFLFASDHYGWFEFNHRAGWTPVFAVLAVGIWLCCVVAWLTTSRLHRMPFQFGLGSLLAIVPVIALPCAWLAVELQKARQEAEIVAMIEAEGGRVDRPIFPSGPSKWDEFLIAAFGIDFTLPVWQVQLATNDHLKRLKFLRSVSSVNLDETSATDIDLEHLIELPKLDVVSLNYSRVTDKGLETLSEMPQLHSVWLNGTDVTDKGVQMLSRVNDLEIMAVRDTRVTQDGIEILRRRFPKLWTY